eukprot:1158227-Pelagomonas_calceolata.AAC.5
MNWKVYGDSVHPPIGSGFDPVAAKHELEGVRRQRTSTCWLWKRVSARHKMGRCMQATADTYPLVLVLTQAQCRGKHWEWEWREILAAAPVKGRGLWIC